jgi:glucose/arabinose dehydrogenase
LDPVKKDNSAEINNPSTAENSTLQRVAGTATMEIITTGLYHPRGLKFGPDGNLYVAEAGNGATALCSTQNCAETPTACFRTLFWLSDRGPYIQN